MAHGAAKEGNMPKKQQAEFPYLDAALPAQKRAADLVGRMTIEEKVRQMTMWDSGRFLVNGRFSQRAARRFFGGLSIGALQDPRREPRVNARTVNAVQRLLMQHTRLGIPALIVSECLHGHMSPGATVFPQAIGLGSTWNPDLVGQMAGVAAREARSVGVAQALAPDLDLARDPRWGRVEETYGEDPYLCSRMAVAYVRGIQGEGPLIDRRHVIATPKHFAAHGSPEAGVNLAPVAVGPRELRAMYLAPFKAAVVEAGALSVMPAYSEIDGVPCSCSKWLLQRILREEWGFQGYVFSDYGAVGMLHSFHHTAATLAEAGKQALDAGMDLEAPSAHAFGDRLLGLVRKGEVPVDLIDQAVYRILRLKFLAGLFENPYADPEGAARLCGCARHRRLARRIAEESIVLMKNDPAPPARGGRGSAAGLLPLDRKIASVAVIGPNADLAQFGDYSYTKATAVTPLQGIRDAASKRTVIHHARGCGIHESAREGFAEAVDAARQSQVAIVVVGGTSMVRAGVGWGSDDAPAATCGEGFDRTNLGLPGVQQNLVKAVHETGTPTVVVLVNGRPYSIPWIAQHVPAILEAWYPGEEGGHALAAILFGRCNPSGKMPVSVPRSAGHVPGFYNHKPSARGYYHNPGAPEAPGRDYVFSSPTPLFAFGHGLSYATFEYTDLHVSPAIIARGGEVQVSVDVQNRATVEGKEVVQLYIRDLVSSVTTPVKTLRRFEKIHLNPGQKRTVRFTLTPTDLSLLDENMQRVVEPGTFEVTVGGLKRRFRVK